MMDAGSVFVNGRAQAGSKRWAKMQAARDALNKMKLKGFQHSRQSLIDQIKAFNGSSQSYAVDSLSDKGKDEPLAANQKIPDAACTANTGSQNSFQEAVFLSDAERKVNDVKTTSKHNIEINSWMDILPTIHSSHDSDNDSTEYIGDLSPCSVTMPYVKSSFEQEIHSDSSALKNFYEINKDKENSALEDSWIKKPGLNMKQPMVCVNPCETRNNHEILDLQVEIDALPHLAETCNLLGSPKHSDTDKPASSLNPDMEEEISEELCRKNDLSTVCSSAISACYETAYGIDCAEEAYTGEKYMSRFLCNQNGGNTRMIHAGIRSNRVYGAPPLYSNSLLEIGNLLEESEDKSDKKLLYAARRHVNLSGQVEAPLCTICGNNIVEITNKTSKTPSPDEKHTCFLEEGQLSCSVCQITHEFAQNKFLQVQETREKDHQSKLASQSSFLFSSRQPSLISEACFTKAAAVTTYSQGQARSELYEICSKNKWAHPVFTCLMEGLDHNKLYTYNVTLMLPGIGNLEGKGEPMKVKKLAMDRAALNLLLQVKSLGCI